MGPAIINCPVRKAFSEVSTSTQRCLQRTQTDPVFLPDARVLGALLLLLVLAFLRQVNGQGLPLHLRQQTLLDQRRLLETRIAIHFHQLIDLTGPERNARDERADLTR